MFKRLAVILMLVLLHLQWGLAQAHDSAEEIQDMVVTAASVEATAAVGAESRAHSQEPGGVCQFHDLAHSPALAALGDGWDAARRLATHSRRSHPDSPLASGVPSLIDRPRWPHHATAVVAL